jgi:hypothetical protein
MSKPQRSIPNHGELVALVRKLEDAPAVSNAAQAALWQDIGAADGWSTMSADDKAAFRIRFAAAR